MYQAFQYTTSALLAREKTEPQERQAVLSGAKLINHFSNQLSCIFTKKPRFCLCSSWFENVEKELSNRFLKIHQPQG